MASGRILVVAPNGDLQVSLVFALEAEGYQVTAKEALPDSSWVASQCFDCTVLTKRLSPALTLRASPSE